MYAERERKSNFITIFLPKHPRDRRLLGRVWWIPRPLQQQQLLPGYLPQVPRSIKTFAGNTDDDDDITDNRNRR
jgi:hypothetical protein